ncbi:hypothetical protein RclHR1_00110018 [Rhizophagus clarus]|uniref:Uncharacterized protein n=1 Tax=Rhizophagus clarus TaxID=94130 RepID=A0A2Z6Q4L4_9GLOM|nr:hypothetical protein RclHR1_00110018 [Rhizophagus clarus]GES98003.1 hypothetical protein GLOIN_2v1836005 [Rhizophagus clarus]
MWCIKDGIKIKVFIIENLLTKSKWLIVRYEEANALFYVIRLGPTFIISRYHIQKLLLNSENKQEHNADRSTFQQEIKSFWAGNLPFVFDHLLNDASKANDMKLIHFLSIGPNIFTPFPLIPKVLQLNLKSDAHIHQQSITEKYPSKDGDKSLEKHFDSSGQINFQTSPTTVLMLRVQPLLRNTNQRMRNQPRRLRIRRQQHNAQINNEDTIYRLTNLPQQQITNNQFIDSFFHGTSFF